MGVDEIRLDTLDEGGRVLVEVIIAQQCAELVRLHLQIINVSLQFKNTWKATNLAKGGGLGELGGVGLGILDELGAVSVTSDDNDTVDLRLSSLLAEECHQSRGALTMTWSCSEERRMRDAKNCCRNMKEVEQLLRAMMIVVEKSYGDHLQDFTWILRCSGRVSRLIHGRDAGTFNRKNGGTLGPRVERGELLLSD